MKVSIIIPNYCHAPYLTERIESVLHQSYDDYEVILLDDCSTDGSREVIERYRSHPRVSHIVYNEQNSGSTFRQWQRGFALASGEYIWIAESDDFAAPEFLSECLAALEEHPRCMVAYTDSLDVDFHSEIIDRRYRHEPRRLYDYHDGLRFVRREMLTHNVIYNASMAVFRRSALPASDAYTRYRYCGDWLFWAQIALTGEVAHIRRPHNFFRQHSAKVSPDAERQGLRFSEGLEVVRRLFAEANVPFLRRAAVAGSLFRKMERFARQNGWGRVRACYDEWRSEWRHPRIVKWWSLLYKYNLRPTL